jgi:hypothetical protein
MTDLINFLPTLTSLAFAFVIYDSFKGFNNIVNIYMILCKVNPHILDIYNVENDLNNDIKVNKINRFWHFFNFLCENNPFIIDYSETDAVKSLIKDESKVEDFKPIVEQRYEDKYLSKYKEFSNEYKFTAEELELEINEYERLKISYEQDKLNSINGITEKLQKINSILNKIGMNNNNNIENLPDSSKNLLIQYFCIDEDEDYLDEELTNPNKLLTDLLSEKSVLENELINIEQTILDEGDLRLKAHDFLLKSKHDQLINNYVLEYTPLGNIYMRYNNDKKSFEYFSNNTIPYRYLEPVGRKYVMTYWCKPLFIDIEEELKIAEQKFEEEKHKKEEEEKNRKEEIKNNKTKNVFAKLKDYNKENKLPNNIKIQAKNRGQQNFVLPPQIKANFPNVDQNSGKQLLKENANRYTWEGRLSNFSPLKKVNKTLVNKNLALTFADFKRIQQINNTK